MKHLSGTNILWCGWEFTSWLAYWADWFNQLEENTEEKEKKLYWFGICQISSSWDSFDYKKLYYNFDIKGILKIKYIN